MSLSRIAASFALLTGLTAAVGCDADTELPDDLVVVDDDETDIEPQTDEPYAESHTMDACEVLGADRSCGKRGDGIQYCAWLYNEDVEEIATYWGECVDEPECTLWSCRDSDDALCDLVDGKPQWVTDSCGY